jgi:hypothetical protein
MMLSVEAFVLKKTMETAMTTTRFTQLPTECVTGFSRDSSAYEASTSAVRHTPASTVFSSASALMSVFELKRCSSPGPSSTATTGTMSTMAAMVMHANRFTSSSVPADTESSSESRDSSTMYFFEMTLRDWNARLDAIAVEKPYLCNSQQ